MRLIYNFFVLVVIILSPIIIIIRIIKKKENPRRFLEKFSLLARKRLPGNLIWFHCSSVGEFLSIIPIIEKLENLKKIDNILVTTSTLSSSKLFNKFKFKKTFHQFYPIDNPIIVNRFLNYWKPSAAFFIESEIWPEMINSINKKNIKIILLNARVSKKSFKQWYKYKDIATKIFNKFDYIFPQNKETIYYLKKLNVKKIKYIGNLKYSETEKFNKLNIYSKIFKKRTVFCAASTHHNEEEIIANLHLKIKNKIKNIITIIIPRHIERSEKILQVLKDKKLNTISFTSNQTVKKNTDIFLVDVYGESKSFYNVSKLVFIGGSIVPKGGQNPLEAIRLGCQIVHGKHIENFKEIFTMLSAKKMSFKVNNEKHLYKRIIKLLKGKNNNKKQIKKFKKIGNLILANYFNEIRNFI